MREPHYPSDMADAEWALIEPLLPVPACQTTSGGHPEAHPRREIVDGIRYLVDNGIKWRAMPADYPPWRTIYGFARRWAAAGIIGIIRDQLRRRIRLASGKTPRAASAIVDSQSIKGSETVGKDTRGWDEAKKINGRKRHLICDNRGLVLLVMVTAANVTDRDAAKELLFRLALIHPEIAIVWADSAYAGKLVIWAKTYLDITIKTVRRPPDAKGFVVLPRRWVVERTWSWIMRARRHCRDHERLPEMSESLITWAAVTLMTRRLTRRNTRPEERRDVTPYHLPQAA
ncbi:IS5 family transposase [Streptomyces sp. NBC_01615]|uniref:IS5 family transposase n=1 Tax=Streptomyces sp. NBC_01615 TaxID=2975898 RepID=UPI00386559C8